MSVSNDSEVFKFMNLKLYYAWLVLSIQDDIALFSVLLCMENINIIIIRNFASNLNIIQCYFAGFRTITSGIEIMYW